VEVSSPNSFAGREDVIKGQAGEPHMIGFDADRLAHRVDFDAEDDRSLGRSYCFARADGEPKLL
jgi:hypothetical protein